MYEETRAENELRADPPRIGWRRAVERVVVLSIPAPRVARAFEKAQGQGKAGKNFERKDTLGSSTFGKCENVCKDKEVARDALKNRWVCKAYKVQTPSWIDRAPLNGQALDTGTNAQSKPPLTARTKASQITEDFHEVRGAIA